MATPPPRPEDLGLGALYALMRDAVTIADIESGLVVLVNPAAERLYGASADDLAGQPFELLVPERFRASIRQGLEELRATGTTARVSSDRPVEQLGLRANGEEFWSELSRYQMSAMGRRFAVVLSRDVSERKRDEQALLASERELRALFAAMTELVIVLDRDGHYVQIAPTSPVLLIRPPEELVGRMIHEVLPAPTADLILAGIRRALDGGQPVEVEYELVVGGAPRSFDATLTPVGDERVLCVIRDVTERRRAEAAERERVRLEGALLAARTAQHGLSNQLALTVGIASLLAEHPRLDEDLRDLARQALDGAEGAAGIVERLQRISRLEEVDAGGPGPVLDLGRSIDQ